VIGVADDHPGAGAEDRTAAFVVGAQGRPQSGRLDPLADRRALAAGDHQPVETPQVVGNADLVYLGAELAQDAGVSLEVALDR
jgi:hypothetical protein